ncbi:MAG: NIL domain-containing protein [Actinomycetota bacterium]
MRKEQPTVRTRRIRLTFPEDLITQPVIHGMVRRFDIVTNIRRADIRESTGWVILEVTGTDRQLDDAIAYAEGLGVQVDDLEAYVE